MQQTVYQISKQDQQTLSAHMKSSRLLDSNNSDPVEAITQFESIIRRIFPTEIAEYINDFDFDPADFDIISDQIRDIVEVAFDVEVELADG